MKSKIKTWIWVWIILIVISVAVSFGTLIESDVQNFPVPSNAELVEKHSDQAFTYNWNGITTFYHFRLHFIGWKKIKQEGSKVTFENGDRRVDFISTKDGFEIIAE